MPDRDLGKTVPDLLRKHPAVKSVKLIGSRARGEATRWSDWDFEIETDEIDTVDAALPELMAPLQPLYAFHDPLSHLYLYIMVLRGPVNVDLFFKRDHEWDPPWQVNRENLYQVNGHFWNWIYWLAGKEARGLADLVQAELQKMFDFLLKPMGVSKVPESIGDAVRAFHIALREREKQFQVRLDRTLEEETIHGLQVMGYQV